MSCTTIRKMKRFILKNKWHSLAMYIVKYATVSSLKNNGINIFSLADFNIEKSTDNGQPIFNKEN